MPDFVINDEQPMRGTLIDAIRVIREYINRPAKPENTLIGTKTGTIVTADDAFPALPKSAKAYGKSTQDGTPTPDAPVEIVSVDNCTLNICGKNLLDPQHFSSREQYTANEDGSITLTAGDSSTWTSFSPLPLSAGTYTLSWLKQRSGQVQIRTSDSDYTTNILSAGTDGFKTFTLASDGGVKIKLGVAVSSYPYTEYVQIELGSTATDYAPYIGTTIPVSLDNHIMRSLPDGTCDELTFTYIEPSEREGWGVYSATLTQNVGESDMGDFAWELGNMTNDGTGRTLYSSSLRGTASKTIHVLRCSDYKYIEPVNPWERCTYGDIFMTTSPTVIVVADPSYDSAAAFKTDSAGVKLQYALDTPITHDLGTVELPILPAPNFTFFANGGNAQPNVQISYERDITIVIDKLEAAEAPVNVLNVNRPISNTFEPSIQPQEETE